MRELRLQAGLSQRELARRAGVHGAQITRWEAGSQGMLASSAAAVARALGVQVEDLGVTVGEARDRTPRPTTNRICELRVKAGLSQRDLAGRAGVTRSQIAHWEAGRYGMVLDNADAVARALGVSVADLGVEVGRVAAVAG